jgi:mRNA-degrading endonuclease toxin of MazEF toxin-antitoxin module
MADQIMTVGKERLTSCIGTLATAELKRVEAALRLQLAL